MKYVVDWGPEPLAILATLWTQSADRKAVTQAQAGIDHLLALNPDGNGVPLEEGLFAIEVYPLRVLYEIDEANRMVIVVAVNELA